MSDFRSRTYSSSSNEHDPYDTPENYYGPVSDPNHSKASGAGRGRAYSVFEKASNGAFENDPSGFKPLNKPETIKESLSNESSNSSLSVSPAPEISRRPSIVPLYTNRSSESVEGIDKDLDESRANVARFHQRRASLDDSYLTPKKFYINDIDSTLKELLQNEDTDHNYQITVDDNGPKVLKLGTANSYGFKYSDVRGTYMLSNLLQELTIARSFGKKQLILDERRLNENPVSRMNRVISTQFWKSLTRQLTKDNIFEMSKDTKLIEDYVDEKGEKHLSHESRRIYVPYDMKDQYEFFLSVKSKFPGLDVQYLPKKIDAKFIRSINKKPGLLALATYPDSENPADLITYPYIVPGGRFNELYGWDSYMITLGLLTDVTPDSNHEHLRIARGMAENFIYEIQHYGKILNANRSYYLGRSQPPFLTDMALRIFNKTVEVFPQKIDDSIDFLKRSLISSIREYNTVWCCKPRLDEETGLSCYHPEGLGIPPETEATHFNTVLQKYTEKYQVSQETFIEMYNNDEIDEPELDEYFLHDRAVRESGHDTSYRLEGKCAYLATVDLNALLYKYEIDIAFILENFFGGELKNPETGVIETRDFWLKKAEIRQQNITKYLWNEEDSIFYDYNVKTKEQTGYESATTFWPLWSRAATQDQADKLVANSLSKFEEFGGLVAGTLKSRGEINIHRPSRQWDYPYAWAPQQILAWIGLINYGYQNHTHRLVYRWLYMMIRAFVDYNGVVVEKYNVLEGAVPHKVDAEYGNQGSDFKGVAKEGFGWVNASFLIGLKYMNLHATRCLGTLTPPNVFLKYMSDSQRQLYQ